VRLSYYTSSSPFTGGFPSDSSHLSKASLFFFIHRCRPFRPLCLLTPPSASRCSDDLFFSLTPVSGQSGFPLDTVACVPVFPQRLFLLSPARIRPVTSLEGSGLIPANSAHWFFLSVQSGDYLLHTFALDHTSSVSSLSRFSDVAVCFYSSGRILVD